MVHTHRLGLLLAPQTTRLTPTVRGSWQKTLLYRRDDEVLDVEGAEHVTHRNNNRDGVFVSQYGKDGEDLDEISPLLRSWTALWALECGGI
jgi:hypothetical protein